MTATSSSSPRSTGTTGQSPTDEPADEGPLESLGHAIGDIVRDAAAESPRERQIDAIDTPAPPKRPEPPTR